MIQRDLFDGRRSRRNKRQSSASEAVEQEALFKWARIMERRIPELALMYHVPNGGSRTPWEARAFKRRGVKAGVPDICLPVARGAFHGLYLELKREGGKASENQDRWIQDLEAQGYCAVVTEGWESARDLILRYLAFPQRAA